MRPELAARLSRIARGDFARKSVRTDGTLERAEKVPTSGLKQGKQFQWHSNRSNTKTASLEMVHSGVGTGVGTMSDRAGSTASEPDPVAIEERKAMAVSGVPEPYLDAWARLQIQKPLRVSDDEWLRAIDDAGRFLDQWGSRAVEHGWTAGDIFDVPDRGKQGGLAWFLEGAAVRSLGPGHAVTATGKVCDRGLAHD